MARVSIVKAEPAHIPWLAANVRPGDQEEFSANYRDAFSVMVEGLQVSTVAWTGMVDDVPICMFGVAPVGFLFPDHGRPWMVGTCMLDDFALLFLRRCRHQVEKMQRLYPVLVNCVAVSNVRAIQWLTWLGFHVEDTPTPVGLRSMPFYRFERRSIQ